MKGREKGVWLRMQGKSEKERNSIVLVLGCIMMFQKLGKGKTNKVKTGGTEGCLQDIVLCSWIAKEEKWEGGGQELQGGVGGLM